MKYWFSPEYFRLYSIHTEGVEERQYQQHLEQAQEFLLVNILGQELKDHLQIVYSDSTATAKEYELLDFIQKYLLYNVELKLCDFLSFRNTSKGVQELSGNDSRPSSYDNISQLRETFKQYIDQYKEKICKFLKDNDSEFPLWGIDECTECYNRNKEQIDVYFY